MSKIMLKISMEQPMEEVARFKLYGNLVSVGYKEVVQVEDMLLVTQEPVPAPLVQEIQETLNVGEDCEVAMYKLREYGYIVTELCNPEELPIEDFMANTLD